MQRPTLHRRGYTLAELLVVIVIILVLVAVALPVARNVMEDSRTREASRQLNSYFALARTRAAATGRPWGIWIDLTPPVGASAAAVSTGPPARYLRQATQFYLAEVPPAYGGATLGARGRIIDTGGSGGPYHLQLNTPGGTYPDASEMAVLNSLVPNDGEWFVVRFDYRGEWFKIQRVSGNYVWTPTLANDYGTMSGVYVMPPSGAGAPFQIIRSPRRVGNPLELTAGTAVDLSYSGYGLAGNQFCLASNMLAVMFLPSGSVEGMYADGALTGTAGTVHFLIGRTDKINDPLAASTGHSSGVNFFDPAKSNLADVNSLWVSVGRQTGAVTTAENMPDADHANHPNPWTAAGMLEFLGECRQVATNREQMGGK